MSSPEGMVFFDTCLACLLLVAILSAISPMKTFQSFRWLRSMTRLMGLSACLFPSLLLAHPGHYHPDETDEFDFLRAIFFHSHGAFDWVVIGLAVCGLAVAVFGVRPALRISALAIGLSALSLLPTL